MVSFIGMFTLVHPFATTWHFPSRENERYEGKNSESYISRTISAFSPFGGERSELITRMRIMPYDTESKSRNADFISIARRAIHHPLNQPAKGRPNPLNLLNPGRRAAP